MRYRNFLPAALLAAFLANPFDYAGEARAETAARKLFGAKAEPAALDPRPIGSYARGCLAGGKMLPISGPGWEAMKLKRNRNWGHPYLVAFLTRFATESHEKDGWPGLLIGDLSQPRGGPMLTGHRSHQIGLDADIWYRPKPTGALSTKEREESWSIPLAEEFARNVTKNWKLGYVTLLKRAASYPETARIFVHPAVKKALCESAGKDRDWLRKIRPWWKHNFHFHVRLKCPAGVAGCSDQDPPPPGDGCGPQLKDWMKKLESAEAWSKKKPKDPVKPTPRREVRMADLPKDCRSVLEAPAAAQVSSGDLEKSPLPKRGSVRVPPSRKPVKNASTTPNLPWLKPLIAPLPERKPR